MSYRFGVPPSVLQAWMPYPDFVLLAVAERTEPRGERREDLRAARLAAVCANPYRPPGSRPYRPSDFLLDFWGEGRRPDPRLAKIEVVRWVLARGGTVIERKRG